MLDKYLNNSGLQDYLMINLPRVPVSFRLGLVAFGTPSKLQPHIISRSFVRNSPSFPCKGI